MGCLSLVLSRREPRCLWRIANLRGILRVFAWLLECGNARYRDPFHPFHHDPCPPYGSGRCPFRCCRVRPTQTSTADPPSLPPARPEPPPLGSHPRWWVYPFHAALPADPLGNRAEAVDPPAPSPDPD